MDKLEEFFSRIGTAATAACEECSAVASIEPGAGPKCAGCNKYVVGCGCDLNNYPCDFHEDSDILITGDKWHCPRLR